MMIRTSGSVIGLSIGVIVVFWIIIGNAFTIYGLLRFKPPQNSSGSERRRRITYHYLFSNAVADLLIGIIVTPLALYQEFHEWPRVVPCKFWIVLDITCCTASCLSLMIISLDRWFTCMRPIPPKWYTDKRADQVIVFVWIMSVTVSALTVHSVDEDNQLKLRSRLFQNESDSTNLRWECVASFSPFYAICSATVSFIIPGIIIVVSNIGIITVTAKMNERNRKRMLASPAGMLQRRNPRAAQKIAANDQVGPLFSISEPLSSTNKASSLDVSKAFSSCDRSRREKRLNRTCTLISICFVFCWLPFVILQSVRSVFPDTFNGVNIIFDVAIWLGWGNSALNPVIYYSNLEHFNRLKTFMLKVLGRLFGNFGSESLWPRTASRSNSKDRNSGPILPKSPTIDNILPRWLDRKRKSHDTLSIRSSFGQDSLSPNAAQPADPILQLL